MTESSDYRVAFFVSGRGSNFKAVLDKMQHGDIQASPAFVLSNSSLSQALKTAGDNQIPTYHVSCKTEGNNKGVEKKMLDLIDKYNPQLLVLAGYMKSVPKKVLKRLPNRVINIHPALLPAFGGQGWYGHFVHEGVIKKGCRYSGITVHLVNEVYDDGAILLQKSLSVTPGEGPEELAARVLKLEHTWLWQVVKGYADGLLVPEQNKIGGLKSFWQSTLD
ncbi:MAG: phosphoribosylglycinamide formyltransferase [Fibrobacteria bacterium]|nr:phosphoribosylglycinamide formyltransferase [Fibrobacteria bacterium]